jgi:hypothetical protein
MSTIAKLQIVSVESFSQQFGNTEYAVFNCETENSEFIPVAVSHNALRSRGVNPNLLDSLLGSTLIANDEVNIITGEFSTGQDRVENVINGTYGILLLNKANSNLIKSEVFKAEMLELVSTTQAKVQTEEKKERKIDVAKRIAERRQAKAASRLAAKATETETPELEVNNDVEF